MRSKHHRKKQEMKQVVVVVTKWPVLTNETVTIIVTILQVLPVTSEAWFDFRRFASHNRVETDKHGKIMGGQDNEQ